MIKKILLLLFLFCSLLLATETKLEYNISLNNVHNGTIQITEHQNYRNVWTILNIQNDQQYRILEQTIKNSQSTAYSIERTIKNHFLGTHLYTITENNINFSYKTTNQQEKIECSLPRDRKAFIISDYLSYIPLLKQSILHPRAFHIIDLKTITKEASNAKLDTLMISYAGKASISCHNTPYIASKFILQGAGKTFQMWLSEHDILLQICDTKNNMNIVLAKKPQWIHAHEQIVKQKQREMPFELDHWYTYNFYFNNKKTNQTLFCITNENNQYICNIKLIRQQKQVATAKIIYSKEWKLCSYYLEEKQTNGVMITIQCDVTNESIKEHFVKGSDALDYVIPFTPNTIFLDNNPIALLAIWIMNFSEQKNMPCVVYHPRRLQCSSAILKILPSKQEDIFELTTPYHSMRLYRNKQGILTKYSQGKLEIVLQE